MTIAHILLFGAAVAASSIAAAGIAVWRGRRAAAAFFLVAGVAIGVATLQVRESERADMRAARHALETRMSDLTARTLVPQSPLACLDAGAGDTVEGGCEKALFASPQTVASAVAYLAARVALLRDAQAFAARYDSAYARTLVPLAHALESDRFGFVAHVLATRDGCTPENCALFASLLDASMVKINLQARTYDAYVTKYEPAWNAAAGPSVAADAPHAAEAGSSAPNADAAPTSATEQGRAVVNSIDFPTAASIPPVSIMDPEPAGKAGLQSKPGSASIPVPPTATEAAAPKVTPPRPKPPVKPPASTATAPQR